MCTFTQGHCVLLGRFSDPPRILRPADIAPRRRGWIKRADTNPSNLRDKYRSRGGLSPAQEFLIQATEGDTGRGRIRGTPCMPTHVEEPSNFIDLIVPGTRRSMHALATSPLWNRKVSSFFEGFVFACNCHGSLRKSLQSRICKHSCLISSVCAHWKDVLIKNKFFKLT